MFKTFWATENLRKEPAASAAGHKKTQFNLSNLTVVILDENIFSNYGLLPLSPVSMYSLCM